MEFMELAQLIDELTQLAKYVIVFVHFAKGVNSDELLDIAQCQS